MVYKNILIKEDSGYLETVGLSQIINKELRVKIEKKLLQEYYYLFEYLIDFVVAGKPNLKNGDTIAFHSWLLKLKEDTTSSFYDILEAKTDGKGFTYGTYNSIEIYLKQKQLCQIHDVTPNFPSFGQKIVISKGVQEGLSVEAVRYPSPNHMSGWWLVTDEYDDNPDSLQVIHLFHVLFSRPDLVKYLALPFGFRFQQNNNDYEVWFDQEVLNDV